MTPNWDGKERRKMNDDWIERDRLLSEVHSDVKHIVEWSKNHDEADNNRFETANKRITWIEKVAYIGIGGIATINIILKFIK